MVKKVLVLGSGGLKIGQAGEFDYSGTQALKALKQEGISSVLINPNIATIQTDPRIADSIYFRPLNLENAIAIIEKERPCGIFLSFGGQTALNLGLSLYKEQVLQKFGVKVLGTPIPSIEVAEDRQLFKDHLQKIDIKTPKSFAAKSLSEAQKAGREIGYPLMLRLGFTLGGLCSGKVYNESDLTEKATKALLFSPQVLLEEYLDGFLEFEYEVVRDSFNNALVVCNMENLDPMGVHTGESIVIAPSQTLPNDHYQNLRSISIEIARSLNVIGECNVQFAVNPTNFDYRVIEMNPRLSRSSALASKATGYPLAFVAAKIALGKRLNEIENQITKKTTAFFEPSLDYVAVKIPKWDSHKFTNSNNTIGTEMKSVGEVMAIGRSFPEALQKAIRMVHNKSLPFLAKKVLSPERKIAKATEDRLYALYAYLYKFENVKKVHNKTKIHPWFLKQILAICQAQKLLEKEGMNYENLLLAKKMGFCDELLGQIFNLTESQVRSTRIAYNIVPVIKQIDTLAGEFDAVTNYLYLTYHGEKHDILRLKNNSHIILGSGPYSIGSSVEFDWCAVNTAYELKKQHKKTIVINSNPETVSTDFDESHRLYFEELSKERVLDIYNFEKPQGIILCVGGQTANNLAVPLAECGVNILGTKAQDIHKAESRELFSTLLQNLKIDQPPFKKVHDIESVIAFAKEHGYPILLRPSYVLSGSFMRVIRHKEELKKYFRAIKNEKNLSLVVSKFIENGKEFDVDGVGLNGQIKAMITSEHVENAGVHSGDATLIIPPHALYLQTIREAKRITTKIIQALNITGPFNIQFIAKENELKVIECNVRASRSFPFASKATGINLMELSVNALLNKPFKSVKENLESNYVSVKHPQFSYSRLKGANPVAHVEMSSTGEVACFGQNLQEAFLASWEAADQSLRGKNILLSIADDSKTKLFHRIKDLERNYWNIWATKGTHTFLTRREVKSSLAHKVSEAKYPNISELISKNKVDIIINIPAHEPTHLSNTDGYKIRRMAIDHNIPLITNLQLALLFVISVLHKKPIKDARSYHDYQNNFSDFLEKKLPTKPFSLTNDKRLTT